MPILTFQNSHYCNKHCNDTPHNKAHPFNCPDRPTDIDINKNSPPLHLFKAKILVGSSTFMSKLIIACIITIFKN